MNIITHRIYSECAAPFALIELVWFPGRAGLSEPVGEQGAHSVLPVTYELTGLRDGPLHASDKLKKRSDWARVST